MRTFICALLLISSTALLLTGCSVDAGPDEKKTVASDPQQDDDWQWEEGSSYDPGYWPKWKNPCPGPACDPPKGIHPTWFVDPPPDYAQERSRDSVQPPSQSSGNGGQQ